MRVDFVKMSGAGNDFVVIDNRDAVIRDAPAMALRLCDRHHGIGADGLLLLESSPTAAYRMMYYNADGSYGGMCGNGGRCIAAFAVRRGLAEATHEFEALDHVYSVSVGTGGLVTLVMKDLKGIESEIVLPLGRRRIKAFFVDTGAPHVVVSGRQFSRKGLEEIDVEEVGKMIRYHKRFLPGGTNVNFIQMNADKSISVRTYERGVEAETLACGTGSIATAIATFLMGEVTPPVTVVPRSKEKLVVDFREQSSGRISEVRLIGPATDVFTGSFEL